MSERPTYDPGGYDPGYIDPDETFSARAGQPLPEGTPVASEENVVEAIRTVYDPEIPVNLYDLGLIYELAVAQTGAVKVLMTLTTPGCPVAGEMPGMVAQAVAALDGAGEVEVELTWDPPWTPERMSEDARLALGIF
jgi:FeS assembly SUF system protein